MTNSSPVLSGFSSTITIDEELANLGPQLLDANVTFTDADDNFSQGTLVMSGLLAEDILSIRNEGTGAGQIGFNGSVITFAGKHIGTAVGGTGGADFHITFKAAATSIAIEALIENLTYENLSDTPTATRTLSMTITDGDGAIASQLAVFTIASGSLNPFNGIDIGAFSAPSFADLDGDGDQDLMIGEYNGNLNYYENTGTALAAAYVIRTGGANPFNGIDIGLLSKPAFVDIDNDGDQDLVIGEANGILSYYKNTGTALAAVYELRTGASNPFNGINIGSISTPSFVDLDHDGDEDLVIGGDIGNLSYYENTGTALAAFYTPRIGTSNPFSGIDVGDYSTPSFIDVDYDGDEDLVIGDDDGTFTYYENIGTVLDAVYALRTGAANPFNNFDIGSDSAPTFVDLDNDGDQDWVSGEAGGTLNYYKNTSISIPANFTLRTGAANPFDGLDIGVRSAPSFVDLDGDGDQELVIGGNDGILNYYENTGTVLSPTYTLRTSGFDPFNGIVFLSDYNTPTFVDIDNDGDQDLVMGFHSGALQYYENTGTVLVAAYTLRTGLADPFIGINVGSSSTPSFVDVDNDGDQDLVIGKRVGDLDYYINTGSALAADYSLFIGGGHPFAFIDIAPHSSVFGWSAPSFVDVDNDGDQDLVIGETDGTLNYYENTGTAVAAIYTLRAGAANPFDGIDVGSHSNPTFTDVDGDGDQDLVIGETDGNLNYYENTATGFGFILNVTPHTDPSNNADVMNGTSGNDVIDSLGGSDTLRGHGGNDTLIGGEGSDVLDGGVGFDLASYENATASVTAKLTDPSQNSGEAFGDTYASIEGLIGSDFGDVLTGTNAGDDEIHGGGGADIIHGLYGNDELHGGAGRDELYGGAGADSMFGGDGNDIYYIDDAGDTVSEAVGEGYDIVHATGVSNFTLGANVERIIFDDTINHIAKGNALDNRLNGNAGNDRFILDEGGADIFSAGQGSDIFDARASTNGIIIDFVTGIHGGDATGDTFASIEKFFGSSTAADTMTTTTARAKFYGFGGDDVLTGGDTIDFLSGGAGNDVLIANGARDGLEGLGGDDTLTGGDDRDYFLYVKTDFGHDTIVDFQDDLDYFKVWSGNNPGNGVAADISDFTITGNGTSTVTVTLNADPTSIITVNSFDGNAMTIDAGDFQFY